MTDTKKSAAKPVADDVYEPGNTETKHNPYDLKVGGKPACTLADGTVPETVTSVANKAE